MPKENGKDTSRNDDATPLALPTGEFPAFFQDFIQPFNEVMGQFFPSSFQTFWNEVGAREPSIDFQDRGDHYLLTAELPGFEKNDVEVGVSSNTLDVKAERNTSNEVKKKDNIQTRRTRSYFQRSFQLPQEVLSDKVSGTMKNGVLELKLPKKGQKAKDKSRRVDLR